MSASNSRFRYPATHEQFLAQGGCAVANIDDVGSWQDGVCGMKCNGELDNKGASDFKCDYYGHWRDCPHFVAG